MANLTLDAAGLVNDVVVTDTAAYFTDSFLSQLYSVRACFFASLRVSHRRHPKVVESVWWLYRERD